MPTKPLPPKLLHRVRGFVQYWEKRDPDSLYRMLSRLKNIDYRSKSKHLTLPRNAAATEHFGGRVREFNVQRNFPGTELVLKRVHDSSAKGTIEKIKEKVRHYNQKQKQTKPFEIREPIAYVVGKELIAMAKTDAPTVAEMSEQFGTKRGHAKARELQKKYGISTEQFGAIAGEACAVVHISTKNMLLLGVENGKLVFMPLLDLL